MKLQKAIINFRQFGDSKMETLCETILLCMKGNAYFVTPFPALDEVQTDVENFTKALKEAASRDRYKVALKNQLRQKLNATMMREGNYVNSVATGDAAMLASSGFPLSKIPEPRHITAPENLVVTQGAKAGQLKSKVKSVKGAYSYMHQITPDPLTKESTWTSITSNKASALFDNLEQAQKYWIRVACMGTDGQIAYSNEVSEFVIQRNAA